MTREEKIKGLYNLKGYLMKNPIELNGYESLPITLIDYAIEALEQEPCEDTVSRKEIIEHYTTGEMANVHHIDKNHLLAFVEQLPPVRPQEQAEDTYDKVLAYLKANADDFPDYHEAIEAVLKMKGGK